MKSRGFTLVELVMVIVITGVIAGSLVVFLKPAIDSYFDSRRRADLTDMADTALRRMSQDIRSAVPNSVRSISATCFQLVPTIAGGRYRMASDTANDTPTPLPCTPSATCSAPVDVTQATTVFDVLSPIATGTVAAGDWIVINNQNTDDVYDAPTTANRAQISAAPTTPRSTDGQHRISIGSKQFSSGYDGGRFVVVPDAARTLLYSCVGNILYRKVTADFAQADTTACGAATDGAVVATDVAVDGCTFVYNLNPGATQESGFVWMRLELSRDDESVALAHGVHVDNAP